MKRRRPLVVLGMFGSQLDQKGEDGWSRWRPTVSLFQHEDLLIDRLVLWVEDRESTRDQAEHLLADIATVSPETRSELHALRFEDPWDFEEVYALLHGFARGYPFAADDEDYLVHITTGTHVMQICLFLLTESRHLPARLVQSSPPVRAGQGPGRYAIIDLDLSRYDQLAMRFEAERREGTSFLKSGIETRNAEFNRQIAEIEQVAIASRAPILLMGPTGAGKSLLARRIYDLKKQRHQLGGAFVEVNCATVRGDAAASALFGHKKGAFTGAVQDRAGLLRSADGGLLFLDEIGELGLDEQAMLLRALEEKLFLPVGADAEVRSDFQLIAGTNRDLQARVRGGGFREDLLARIDLWTYRLPGLRERLEDLEPNLDYELEQVTRRTGRRVTFNKEARQRFLTFATSARAQWSANFRDLNASVTRMATLAPGGRIQDAVVVQEIARLERAWCSPAAAISPLAGLLDESALARIDRFDRAQLEEVVRVCQASPSLSAAGRELFQASRLQRATANDADRLRKYLARFGLSWAAVRAEA
jgi:transcriptional regulatory protein RtcR